MIEQTVKLRPREENETAFFSKKNPKTNKWCLMCVLVEDCESVVFKQYDHMIPKCFSKINLENSK